MGRGGERWDDDLAFVIIIKVFHCIEIVWGHAILPLHMWYVTSLPHFSATMGNGLITPPCRPLYIGWMGLKWLIFLIGPLYINWYVV